MPDVAPAKDAPKEADKPKAGKILQGHLTALAGAKLGLDRSGCALLLAHLLVDRGEGWVLGIKSAELVAEARRFASATPIAWRHIALGNVMGMAKGLELYGKTVAPSEEYARLVTSLMAPAEA